MHGSTIFGEGQPTLGWCASGLLFINCGPDFRFRSLSCSRLAVMVVLALSAVFLGAAAAALSYRHPVFSTKTPYRWLLGDDDFFPYPQRRLESKFGLADGGLCRAMSVSAVVRHGLRNPGLSDIRHMDRLERLFRGRGSELNPVAQPLGEWRNSFSEDGTQQLTGLGRAEQRDIGYSFGAAFRELFLHTGHLRFVSSTKDRCRHSAEAFQEGLRNSLAASRDSAGRFGRNATFTFSTNDRLLRFHAMCLKYIRVVETNSSALLPLTRFKRGALMRNLTRKVSERIGYKNYTFQPGDIKLMYILCAFETALYNKSHWCSLLEKDEFKIVEYLSDLKQYWKKSYGHHINYMQSCPLVSDIFSHMDAAIQSHKEGKEYVTGSFQFGHVETLAPVYAALGLFNDSTPLMADNYFEQKDRNFQSSKILPFSANLAIVIYHCKNPLNSSSSNAAVKDEYMARFYVNERPILMPECNALSCLYSDLKRRYNSFFQSCNFNEICGLKTNTANGHNEL